MVIGAPVKVNRQIVIEDSRYMTQLTVTLDELDCYAVVTTSIRRPFDCFFRGH